MRVDAGHVFEGLDARLTVAGHFFAPGARAFVGQVALADLEDLGLDPEPPHYHRLRGNLPAERLPVGRYDVSVLNPSGEAGLLPQGFAVLERGDPTPTPDLPVRLSVLSASEFGRIGARSAFAPGQIMNFHLGLVNEGQEAAPLVLVVELRGPEGQGTLHWRRRSERRLEVGQSLFTGMEGPLVSADMPAGEYSLSATLEAFGKQVERSSQIYLASEPVLLDDFEDPGSGWQVGRSGGVETSYAGGEYRISVIEPGILGTYWPLPWRQQGDGVVEVDARSLTDALAELGLAVEISEDGDRALWFRVSNTGQWRVTRRAGDVQAQLTDWIYAPELRGPREPQHLMVVRRDGQLRLYADGRRLRSIELLDPRAGWLGLLAGAFDEPSEARFDDFRAYRIR